MDPVTLRSEVESDVNGLCETNTSFTTATVSHPLIARDSSVRHREVKEVVDDMWAKGERSF